VHGDVGIVQNPLDGVRNDVDRGFVPATGRQQQSPAATGQDLHRIDGWRSIKKCVVRLKNVLTLNVELL